MVNPCVFPGLQGRVVSCATVLVVSCTSSKLIVIHESFNSGLFEALLKAHSSHV